jgi:hypothetical protein
VPYHGNGSGAADGTKKSRKSRNDGGKEKGGRKEKKGRKKTKNR